MSTKQTYTNEIEETLISSVIKVSNSPTILFKVRFRTFISMLIILKKR